MTTAIRLLSILIIEKQKLSVLKKGINLLKCLEINQKIKQGCNQILLSRLFETNYKNKKGFLGKIKFNLLSRKS